MRFKRYSGGRRRGEKYELRLRMIERKVEGMGKEGREIKRKKGDRR